VIDTAADIRLVVHVLNRNDLSMYVAIVPINQRLLSFHKLFVTSQITMRSVT